MNYQLLLEFYSSGTEISKDELQMLDIELDTQIESIKVSGTEGCLHIAPKHICEAALVCEGSFWITCLASVLDKLSPPSLGSKAKGAILFDELVRQGYVKTA
tara:strand:+ start:22317 stop:22622 length:306 start_codon:yes stop_codon:yes gene_type:complete